MRYQLTFLRHVANRAGVKKQWLVLLQRLTSNDVYSIYDLLHLLPFKEVVQIFRLLRGASLIVVRPNKRDVLYTSNWRNPTESNILLREERLNIRQSRILTELKALIPMFEGDTNLSGYQTVKTLLAQYKNTDPECIIYSKPASDWIYIAILDDAKI